MSAKKPAHAPPVGKARKSKLPIWQQGIVSARRDALFGRAAAFFTRWIGGRSARFVRFLESAGKLVPNLGR